ncbi:MAG: antibiotic biosynthesis monooxygenase [Candidatus Limnocylindria bacterium]|nr:antibiotic biosynthesis monooxygenase [Candidatus Limnocylindria bacterium]
MYGTIQRGKVRKDRVRELMALGKEWDARERTRAVGYISSELLWCDEGEGRFCMIVHFTSKDACRKNAESPEMDAFYQKIRACLEADPEWIDGTFTQWDGPYAQVPAF